jgi:quercetin dioxygenase-like cupin family protein
MATRHAKSGELIDLHPAVPLGDDSTSDTLVRSDHLEVFRLSLPAGKVLPPHAVPSFITVQCLAGRVEFTAHGTTRTLTAGTMLFLDGGESHALRALEDSSILVTLRVNRK